jgi:hypothetical protein
MAEWQLINNGKLPAEVPPLQMVEINLADYRRLKVLARFVKNINGRVLAYREIK